MSVGTFNEEMFRERAKSIRIQLLVESTCQPVGEDLSTYTHRLMAKRSHGDADVDAVFDYTNIFVDEDNTEKIVAALIPATATDAAALPEGDTNRLYLQWQVTDGNDNPWIVAAGRLTVRSSLPYTP